MSARGRELKEAIAVVIGGTDGGSCCKLLFQPLLIFVCFTDSAAENALLDMSFAVYLHRHKSDTQ